MLTALFVYFLYCEKREQLNGRTAARINSEIISSGEYYSSENCLGPNYLLEECIAVDLAHNKTQKQIVLFLESLHYPFWGFPLLPLWPLAEEPKDVCTEPRVSAAPCYRPSAT